MGELNDSITVVLLGITKMDNCHIHAEGQKVERAKREREMCLASNATWKVKVLFQFPHLSLFTELGAVD